MTDPASVSDEPHLQEELERELLELLDAPQDSFEVPGHRRVYSPGRMYVAVLDTHLDRTVLRVRAVDGGEAAQYTRALVNLADVGQCLWATETDLIVTRIDASGRAFEVLRMSVLRPDERLRLDDRDDGLYWSISRTTSDEYIRIVGTDRARGRILLHHRSRGQTYDCGDHADGERLDVDHGDTGIFVVALRTLKLTAWFKSRSPDRLAIRDEGEQVDSLRSVRDFLSYSVLGDAVCIVVPDRGGTSVLTADLGRDVARATWFGPGRWVEQVWGGPDVYGATISALDAEDQEVGFRPGRDCTKGSESDLCTVVTWAASWDGAQVPVTMLRMREWPKKPRPTLLLVYGCYGNVHTPSYGDVRQLLLRRGIAVAIAHVRGGGDLGWRWHQAGRGVRKRNSVADLVAVADHLIENKWSEAGAIVLRAQSAGAAVALSAAQRRPGAFAGVVGDKPHIDVANIHGDGVYLVDFDLAEWGVASAGGPSEGCWTPYETPIPTSMPPVLLRPSTDDGRVSWRESGRYQAFIRDALQRDRVALEASEGQHTVRTHHPVNDREELARVFRWIIERLTPPGRDNE